MEAVQDGSQNVGGEGIRFAYDFTGARVLKIDNPNSMTAYVNQFYVVQNPQNPALSLATKEIFIGNNRVAAQIAGAATTATGSTGSNVSSTAAWVGAWGVSIANGNVDAANFGSPQNFITIEKNNTPVMGNNPETWTTLNQTLGVVNATQVMTLVSPEPIGGYFEVEYGGQDGYVLTNAAVVGFPVTISTNNTSLMPKNSLVFFYHTDQIGSTGYMTDATGTLSEHLEYIPFGETWLQQERGTQVLPNYEFSGKELDTETGLYYFGARYYDPRTSVWMSPDAILSKYLNGTGNGGGVYNPFNLSLYTYAQQNPVLLIDPDGNMNEATKKDLATNLKVSEGVKNFLYLDTKGKVTTGAGTMLSSAKDAEKLNWVTSDGKTASKTQIDDAFKTVSGMESGKRHNADSFKSATNITLKEDTDQVLRDKIDSIESELESGYPGFEQMPESVQEGMTDMAYNCGVGKLETGFPNFNGAIAAGNYSLAGTESHRGDPISAERNEWTKGLFDSAASSGPHGPTPIPSSSLRHN